jgi:hypothetical protein
MTTMTAEKQHTRYLLMLSVAGGWPDESLVPRPDDMERELKDTFALPLSVKAAETAQNPAANACRPGNVGWGQRGELRHDSSQVVHAE